MALKIDEEPLRTVVENVERLLNDARIVLEHGSPGSALSLAILAFEEAGKGHSLELAIEKTKRTPSWHIFRQVTSSFVLMASLYQKYELPAPELSPHAREILDERLSGKKTLAELMREPVPQEYHDEALDHAKGILDSLSPEQAEIFPHEMRWVRKIIRAASEGRIEVERQRGMYVDVENGSVTSSPLQITKHEAYYWIRVAERTIRLLKHGEYAEPYGELAAFLSSLPRPLPPIEEIMETVDRMRAAHNEGETSREPDRF